MIWMAVAGQDTFKLVNLGPGPRQMYAEEEWDIDNGPSGVWNVWIDHGPGDDDAFPVAGPFDSEDEAFAFIRAVAVTLCDAGMAMVMDRNDEEQEEG